MKFLFSATFVLLMAVLVTAPDMAVAQGSNPLDPTVSRKQVLVGPVVGINRNFHTGGFRTIDDPGCPLFEDGTGWGYIVGLTAEFLPSVNGTWGIIPRVMFEQRPGQFSQELPDAQVLLPGATEPVNQTVSTSSDITYTLLTAQVMYKQEFANIGGVRLGAAAGPSFNYVLGGHNRQVQDLDEPQNARFINPTGLPTEENGRRLIFFDNDIPARNSTRFSIMGGIQGEIGLFNNAWIMTPGVYYDYGLTDVTNAENWGLSTIMFMVDFRRAF